MKLVSLLSLLFISIAYVPAKAAEGDTYSFTWLDQDKEVYVLQNRKFRKAGRLYAMLGGGITTSGAFVDGNTIQGRAGFFFREQWGFEVIYSKNSGKENETAQSVRNPGGSGSTPFRRITENYMGGMFMWSPFYSKINTFNSILYLDWHFGLGLAKLDETNNSGEYINNFFGEQQVTESHTGVMWDVGFKVYLNENWAIRTDFLGINYQADRPTSVGGTSGSEKDWYHHYDLTVAIVYDF